MPTTVRHALCCTTLFIILAITGCASEETTPPPEVESTSFQASAPQNNLLEAVRAEGLDTLARLLSEAGLESVLEGEGPYTLLAPTDEAFAALSDPSPDELGALLRYHVIPGRFEITSLAGSMEVNTLEGPSVTFEINESPSVRDAAGSLARIIVADDNVDNGVLHIIDRVLSPGTP